MNKLTPLLIVTCLLVPAALAQDNNPQAPLPSLDQVLDRYVQAVGGRSAIEKLTSRVMKGSLVAPGGAAPMEIYEKTPNKFLRTIDSPASGMNKNGFDGSVAWSQNQQHGIREMGGPQVELLSPSLTMSALRATSLIEREPLHYWLVKAFVVLFSIQEK